MPSSKKVRLKLLKMMDFQKGDQIFELGAGWGGIAFALSKQFPDCTIVAIEKSWIPFFWIKIHCFFKKRPNLQVICKNFFNISLSEANGIVCYLSPFHMRELEKKFQSELKPGTKIFSHTFSLPSWKNFEKCEGDDLFRTPIYLYEKGES